MTKRAARLLTRLYPPSWQARYGEEFQTFLESRRVPLFETLDIVAAALSERLAGWLPILVYACLATIAAGGTLYLTASGVPVARAIDAHRVLWLCWIIIEASSVVVVSAGVAAVTPVVFRVLRKPSRDVLWKLAKPVCAGLMLTWWLMVAGASVRKPAGSWLTLLGLATFAEQVAGFSKYVIANSELSQSLGRAKLALLTMAAAIMITSMTAAGWGLVGKSFAADGFSLAALSVYWIVVVGALAFPAASAIRRME